MRRREKSEQIIDELHAAGYTEGSKKPRTYREKARKQNNSYSKDRKKNEKKARKCIRQQLGYLIRNLSSSSKIMQAHPECMKAVNKWLRERLPILITLCEQQKEMYDGKIHRITDRIVLLSQWWVRPIVRGKQRAETEFGAEEAAPGIYYLSGPILFPTQVIVTSELLEDIHPSLKLLSRKVRKADIEAFIRIVDAFSDAGDQQRADAVLEVSTTANEEKRTVRRGGKTYE